MPPRRGPVVTGVWSAEGARLAVESGIFARWQARLAGISDEDVYRAIKDGRLRRLDVGVYTRAAGDSAARDAAAQDSAARDSAAQDSARMRSPG